MANPRREKRQEEEDRLDVAPGKVTKGGSGPVQECNCLEQVEWGFRAAAGPPVVPHPAQLEP